MVTKALINFLFDLKIALKKILGKNYFVEVFYPIEMMEEFNYCKHCFQLCMHGDLVKIDITEWTVTIRLKFAC